MDRAGLKRLLPLLAFAVTAALYAVLLMPLASSRGVWVNDEGNRMLQIRSFAEGKGGYLRDPLEGNILPGLAPFAPGGYMVREPEQHRIISGYSEAFPFLVSGLYRIGHFESCLIYVLLAGLACSAVVWRILRELGAGPCREAEGILLTGWATPLLFYSGTLLEITFAAVLTSLTFLLIQTAWKSRFRILWTVSGLTAALVPWFREEGYVIGAALILALLIRRPGENRRPAILFTAGFLPGIASLLIFNELRYGTLFGLHHLIYREIQPAQKTLGSVLRSVWFFLFEPAAGGVPGIFCGAVCLLILLIPILFLLYKKAPENKILPAVSILIAAAAVLNAFFLLSDPNPMEMTLRVQSICSTVPFVLFPILFACHISSDSDPFQGFLLRSVLLASAGIAILLEYNTRGMFFGPRHFVPLLPMFAVLAVLCIKNFSSATVRIPFLAVCLISAVCQFRGVRLLEERKNFGDKLNKTCHDALVSPILTDVFFVPEELAWLNWGTLWIQSEGIPVFRALAQHKELPGFVFITSDRFASAPELIPALSGEWRFKKLCRLENPDMKLLALNIYKAERISGNHGKRTDTIQPQ